MLTTHTYLDKQTNEKKKFLRPWQQARLGCFLVQTDTALKPIPCVGKWFMNPAIINLVLDKSPTPFHATYLYGFTINHHLINWNEYKYLHGVNNLQKLSDSHNQRISPGSVAQPLWLGIRFTALVLSFYHSFFLILSSWQKMSEFCSCHELNQLGWRSRVWLWIVKKKLHLFWLVRLSKSWTFVGSLNWRTDCETC